MYIISVMPRAALVALNHPCPSFTRVSGCGRRASNSPPAHRSFTSFLVRLAAESFATAPGQLVRGGPNPSGHGYNARMSSGVSASRGGLIQWDACQLSGSADHDDNHRRPKPQALPSGETATAERWRW
jgi:hypothetical protein